MWYLDRRAVAMHLMPLAPSKEAQSRHWNAAWSDPRGSAKPHLLRWNAVIHEGSYLATVTIPCVRAPPKITSLDGALRDKRGSFRHTGCHPFTLLLDTHLWLKLPDQRRHLLESIAVRQTPSLFYIIRARICFRLPLNGDLHKLMFRNWLAIAICELWNSSTANGFEWSKATLFPISWFAGPFN